MRQDERHFLWTGINQDGADGMRWAATGDRAEAGNHLIIRSARSLNPPGFVKHLCRATDGQTESFAL